MLDSSGWGDKFIHDYDMNHEIILRHPIVNLYNNQLGYEGYLSYDFEDDELIKRGNMEVIIMESRCLGIVNHQ